MSSSLMKMKCYTSLHKIFIIFTCVEIKFIAKVHLCSVWPHKVFNNSINLVCNVLCFVCYCSFEVHYGIWYQKSSSAMNRNIIITINCWFKNWPQILVFATIYLEQINNSHGKTVAFLVCNLLLSRIKDIVLFTWYQNLI